MKLLDPIKDAVPGTPVKANQITNEEYNKSRFGKAVGQEEDEVDNQLAEYDFETMIKVKQAKQLVMNMSFNIDTSQLYVLEKSCMQN